LSGLFHEATMPSFQYGLLLPSQAVMAQPSDGASPFAYGTVSGADAYHAARGNVAWTGTTAEKLAALVRASSYIDATYGARFSGVPTNAFAQPLAWPRAGVSVWGNAVPSTLVPTAVINAAYEAALIERVTPGSFSVSGSASSAVKREKVEGAVEIEYQTNSGAWTVESMLPVLSSIEGLLKPFLRSAEAGIGIWVI
jgi:hypothetical protein